MPSQFDGMSVAEMNQMPCVAEATGQPIAVVLGQKPNMSAVFSVALAQEGYVRRVYLRCPPWRRRKRHALSGALKKARVVADVSFNSLLEKTRPA
jgi:hypothetical protein